MGSFPKWEKCLEQQQRAVAQLLLCLTKIKVLDSLSPRMVLGWTSLLVHCHSPSPDPVRFKTPATAEIKKNKTLENQHTASPLPGVEHSPLVMCQQRFLLL